MGALDTVGKEYFSDNSRFADAFNYLIYEGSKPWDGPMSLHNMMDFKDEKIRQFVPDYRINLISPVDMDEADIKKFQSDLAFSMEVLKHQEEGADKIIEAAGHRKVDIETARFLNIAAKLEYDFEEEGGKIDMCAAMEKRSQRDQITGAIRGMRVAGMDDNTIVDKIIEMYQVTKDYVMALLAPQPQES